MSRAGGMKRGVVFCGGHATSVDRRYDPFFDDVVEWVRVDIDRNARPDVVGDYTSHLTLQRLGYESYDYVIDEHCPITSYDDLFRSALSAFKLLKDGGQLIGISFASKVASQMNAQLLGIDTHNPNRSGRQMVYEWIMRNREADLLLMSDDNTGNSVRDTVLPIIINISKRVGYRSVREAEFRGNHTSVFLK